MRSRFGRGRGTVPKSPGLVRLQEPNEEPTDGFVFVDISNERWESYVGAYPPTEAYQGFKVTMPISVLPDVHFPPFDFGTISKQPRAILDAEVAKRRLVVPSDVRTRDDLQRWMIANPKLFGHS